METNSIVLSDSIRNETKHGYFKLHNKDRNIDFKVAPFGVWNTSNLTEAKEMLAACREYLQASGLGHISKQIILKDLDTNEEFDL